MDWQAGWDGGWMKKASLGAVKVSFMIQNVITIDNPLHDQTSLFFFKPWTNNPWAYWSLSCYGIQSLDGGAVCGGSWQVQAPLPFTWKGERVLAGRIVGRNGILKAQKSEGCFRGSLQSSLSLNTWVEKREILVFLMGGFSVIFANPARCLFVSMPFIISFSIFIYVFVVTFYPKINHLFPQQKNSCSMILTFSNPFPPVACKVHDAAINIWEMMMGGTFRRAVRAPKKDPWDEGLNWWCQIEGLRILLRICVAKSKGWWCQDLTVTSQGFPAVNMPRKWVSVFLDNSNVPCIFIDELRIRTCWESLK